MKNDAPRGPGLHEPGELMGPRQQEHHAGSHAPDAAGSGERWSHRRRAGL